MDNLLECPFCKKLIASIIKTTCLNNGVELFHIHHGFSNCILEGFSSMSFETPEEAVEVWNAYKR